jgi:hypothetical protein
MKNVVIAFMICATCLYAQWGIRITSPAAGTTLYIGEECAINWTTRIGTHNMLVDIALLDVEGNFVMTIAEKVLNKGGYTWRIPKKLDPGKYIIGIRSLDGTIFGRSNSFIIKESLPLSYVIIKKPDGTIAKLKLEGKYHFKRPPRGMYKIYSPKSGDVWTVENGYTIEWETPAFEIPFNVMNIILWDDQGNAVLDIATTIAVRPNRFKWTIPIDIPSGAYRIAITSLDGEILFAVSDLFEIIGSNLPDLVIDVSAPSKINLFIPFEVDITVANVGEGTAEIEGNTKIIGGNWLKWTSNSISVGQEVIYSPTILVEDRQPVLTQPSEEGFLPTLEGYESEIHFLVDPDNKIEELNEENNRIDCSIETDSLPEFGLYGHELMPISPIEGHENMLTTATGVKVEFAIRNYGADVELNSSQVLCMIEGHKYRPGTLLEHAEVWENYCELQYAEHGDYVIPIEINPAQDVSSNEYIDEWDRNNNLMTPACRVLWEGEGYISAFWPAGSGSVGDHIYLRGVFCRVVDVNEVQFEGMDSWIEPRGWMAGAYWIYALGVYVPPEAQTGYVKLRNRIGEIQSMEMFYLLPEITGVHPNKRKIGQKVTIAGNNFDWSIDPQNIVKFNGVEATGISNITATSIKVVVPEGATSGPLTVETKGGIATWPMFEVQ